MFSETGKKIGANSLPIWVAGGMALGANLGIVLGATIDSIDIGIGIAMGASIGCGLGATFDVIFGAEFEDE